MWDRVLDGETRYIKGFKTTADFLLDTSFTYELGLISKLLGVVRRQFTLEGHNAELWDETARRFEHVAPLELELLPGLLELGASVPPQAVSNETDMTAANATAAIFLDNLILMFLLFLV